MDWAKSTARWDEKRFGIWCTVYQRFYGNVQCHPRIMHTVCTLVHFVVVRYYLILNIHFMDIQLIGLSLRWCHNGHYSISNHQPHDCLLNCLFRRRSKKTSKLRVTVLCAGNSPGTSEFPTQMASNVENVSIWWRHHVRDVAVMSNL